MPGGGRGGIMPPGGRLYVWGPEAEETEISVTVKTSSLTAAYLLPGQLEAS